MATSAVTLILNDHRALEALFEQVESGKGDRQELMDEIVVRLSAHARAEEREVYPAIKKADPSEDAEVEHAYDEHVEAEHLLLKARNLVGSPHFEQAFTEFVGAVKHHVEEEETEILPALEKAVDPPTLKRLGDAFERARREELTNAGLGGAKIETAMSDAMLDPEMTVATVDELAAEKPADTPELAEATRDELYQMARDADIPGRSSMTKSELAEALQEGA